MCTVLTSWDAFPLMLPHQQLHQEMVTFIEPVAKSQSSNKDDCSLKMILIFKFGPVFLAMHSFDVFYSSRTNCSYRNPGFVEYDNLNTILFPNRQW